ncbi:MAG: SRPBCC domain-containing protein [Gammaproteobacteria bacterium]
MEVTVETTVSASLKRVWEAWVTPEDIRQWNFANDDWSCPNASLELGPGGQFNYRMESRDGSMGFDFEGTFIRIIDKELIEYELGDKRKVSVAFSVVENGVRIVESFDAEDENDAEQQKDGWQRILNNFKTHVEATGA